MSLHHTILSAIHHHGPQSIMSLWHHTKQCQPLAGVFVAAGELSDDGFIEKCPTLASIDRWQLTEKGRQRIAAIAAASTVAPCNGAESTTRQEVEIGPK